LAALVSYSACKVIFAPAADKRTIHRCDKAVNTLRMHQQSIDPDCPKSTAAKVWDKIAFWKKKLCKCEGGEGCNTWI